jgi:anti-sigma B factor antagonist
MFDGTMRVIPPPESMSRKQQTNVLPLNGEIDLHVSPEVADSLRTMIEKKPNQIVVDLTEVTYLDSSGLAVLIEGMQNVQKYGGRFGLAGVQDDVKHIFDIARLDQVFEIYPDVDAALAATKTTAISE